MSILVVGSVAFDDLETPVGKRLRTLGGSAVHFSMSASFFTDIKLVGVVGSDFDGEHVDFLKSRPICLEGLEIIQDGKTFCWSGKYSHDLNSAESLRTDLNVFATFNPKMPEHYKEVPHVFLANIDPVLQQRVLDQVHDSRWVACDTMNYWINTKPEALKATLRRVTIFLLNEAEARLLTGEYNIVKAARLIQEMGPRIVVIKRGEYGALLFNGEAIFMAPALPMEHVADPTGAGDSFAGGFLGCLVKEGDITDNALKKAMICGSVMASFQVEDFSLDRLRRLTYVEIRERFDHFEQLSRFSAPLD